MICTDDYLMHHGILGQKWGVRRFQNKDGSLTAQGKAKYRTDSVVGNVGRALTNSSLGQRIWGVGVNKGFRQDLKEINTAYKDKKNQLKNDSKLDSDKRKEKMKSLKEDYRKTIDEARITAANALYPWQSKSQNEKIQTQNYGKQIAKEMLLGSAGNLTYDRLSADNVSKGKSVAAALAMGTIQTGISYAARPAAGVLNTVDYAVQAVKYNKGQKKK